MTDRTADPTAHARPLKPGGLGDILTLIGCLVLTLGIGWAASAATLPAIPTWYAGLEKPFFTPPNAVFGPVWTVLYIMIAVSLWRTIRAPASAADRRRALTLQAAQLVANFAWSFAFFGAHNPILGLVVIVALDLSLIATIAAARRVDRPAALLLVPYLLWVLYATALNGAIVALNG